MHLRTEVVDGVDVLLVSGPVRTADAADLQRAVRHGLDEGQRGVLVDLSGAEELAPEAVDALNWLTGTATGWPRPALAVCCAPPDLTELLVPAVQVHPNRDSALAHIDDHEHLEQLLDVHLPQDEGAPRRARALARACAEEHGLPSDDLQLVVSELVTNAVRYGGAPVRLSLERCDHCLTVVVADSGGGRPAARAATEDGEGGRGLLLVDLLAHDSGVRPDPPGKAVWAELPLA